MNYNIALISPSLEKFEVMMACFRRAKQEFEKIASREKTTLMDLRLVFLSMLTGATS